MSDIQKILEEIGDRIDHIHEALDRGYGLREETRRELRSLQDARRLLKSRIAQSKRPKEG